MKSNTFAFIHQEYKKSSEALRSQYREVLVKEANSPTTINPTELVKIFISIAGSNIELAEQGIAELKLQYYNDAASVCQYALKITENDDQKTEVYGMLNLIQSSIVKLCGGSLSILKGITGQTDIDGLYHREQLQALRDQIKGAFQVVEAYKEKDEKLYIDGSADLFKSIASGMEKYLAGLYQKAESIVGLAPCKYAVIGLGSMALRQMTPYSDLECALLTENDDYKQSDDPLVRHYFKNLSHLVHFMTINLGETSIPFSSYGVNLDKFIPQAVNFDLGGKTPVGRIEQDKPYELIQTVEGMLHYLKNEAHKTEHIDKNLAAILQKTCLVYGEPELVQSYQIESQRFLERTNKEGQTNFQARAITALWEGVEEFDYTKANPSSKIIEGNLKQFFPDLSDSEGRLFDVKQEIYRLPDRLIYNLGLIYGVQEESSWDTLDKLCELGKISPEGAQNLKKALTFATNLRLKTYDHYGYQKETMDFSKAHGQDRTEGEELIEAISGIFKLKKEDLKPDGALFEYYKAVLPLHEKLKEFCSKKDIKNKDGFFVNEEFYSSDSGTIAAIHLRLLQYEKALTQQLLALEELKTQFGSEHPNVATSLNNVGYTYSQLGKYESALQYKLEALELRKKLLGQKHPDVAASLNNVGYTYGYLGKHELALQYKLEALELRKRLLGPEHPDVAMSFNNVGITYGYLGKHELALQYGLEALGMRKKLLGQEHPHIVMSLNNVGTTYNDLGRHELALQYQLEALELSGKLLSQEHPYVVGSLGNVKDTYNQLDQHKLGLRYQLKVLELFKELSGQEHPDVAASLNNVGATYSDLGRHELALQYHVEALEMRKKLLGQEHPDVATSLNNIGVIYGHLGKPKLALQYLRGALEMRQKLLEQEHPDVAASLNNVGVIYGRLGKHNEALQYKLKALELRKKLLDEEHPYITGSINDIGVIYGYLGEHNKALQYKLKALELRKKVLGEEHPYIITSLNNIGMIYGQLGNPEIARQYKLKALELLKKLLEQGEGYPHVTTNLNHNKETKTIEGDFVPKLNSETLPEKSPQTLRFISYNITVDYFDEKDKTEDSHHHWKFRAPFVAKLLESVYPDIMCLQELSSNQALELHQYFGSKGYSSAFLSQIPSEIEAGLIVHGEGVKGWCGKKMGTPLVATFISSSCKFLEVNKFWLNEYPNQVPSNVDREETDKGFGNIDTYRAVLWTKVQVGDNKILFVFNSYYPLSGGNKVHLECAKLEKKKIEEITQGASWISAGDRNIIPSTDNDELRNPKIVHKELSREAYSFCNSAKHYGINTTWIGFSYDEHQNQIKEGKFQDDAVLDLIVSSLNPIYSFFLHGGIDPVRQELLPLLGTLGDEQNDGRYFASDHALIGADFVWL